MGEGADGKLLALLQFETGSGCRGSGSAQNAMSAHDLKRPISRGLHYAWVVAGITFLTLIVAAAVRATPSILIVPLEREFGWSPATISCAISVNLLLYGLIGP